MMKGTENEHTSGREDVFEKLFSHAVPRERPPAGTESEIRTSLHGQWSAMTRRRRLKRRGLFAAAASVAVAAIAAVALFESPPQPEAGERVAEVLLTRGHASLNPPGDAPGVRLEPDAVLRTGQEVRTAPGAGLALRWQNGITLRLDQDSRVLLLTTGRAELLAGRVYVDTDTAGGPGAELVFDTPAGPVRHEGTRYMVGVSLGTTSVSVREGIVLLGDESAGGGEQLVVTADGGQRREEIQPYGEPWAWTEKLATPFEADGRTVAELLAWVGRETGRSVEYASPSARQLAEETRIHGNIGTEPMKVLRLAMETTDLEAEIRDGTIFIETGPAP